MKKIYSLVFAAAVALIGNSAKAQIVNCNAFLQGNYVEIGITPIGSFGSSVAQPAVYHGNAPRSWVTPCYTDSSTGHGLGFMADPDMDGWSVGTPPYFGDYFLPGTPYEGWSIQVAGSRVDAFNTQATFTTTSMAVTSGSHISDSLIGGTYTSIWQGMMDSLQITQVVTLDTGSLYFNVNVTLTNLGSTALDSIYYMRSVDPDNAEMELGGGFPTNNMIRAQYPDTSFALVSATDVYFTNAYLGIGTTDSNAKVLSFTNWPPTAGDLSLAYSETATFLGTGYYTMGDSIGDQDIAIGIVYSIPHLAPADSASSMIGDRTTSNGLHPANSRTLSYFYSFSPAASDSGCPLSWA